MKNNCSDDFVRDIESYYLNLKGEGIMLSPKEYDLIVNWRSRSVPKEVVIRGIRRTFEKGFTDDQDRKRNFRSLTQCAANVEELIREYKSSQHTDPSEAKRGNKDMVQLTVERLNEIILAEKREFIRQHYIESRKRILELLGHGEADLFNRLRQIEADFYEDVFQNMSGVDKKRLIEQAEANLSTRERFMTKEARMESLISFRNELMMNELKLVNFNIMY